MTLTRCSLLNHEEVEMTPQEARKVVSIVSTCQVTGEDGARYLDESLRSEYKRLRLAWQYIPDEV